MRVALILVLVSLPSFAAAAKKSKTPKTTTTTEPAPAPAAEPTKTAEPAPAPAPEPAPPPKSNKPQQGGAGQSNLEQGSAGDRPWASGVSASEQKVALDLFKEGNVSLKEPNFARAVQKYREALSHWDHPAIHYNMALALLNLDQPVETHEHFSAALKYGAAPLDADKFEQATRYKKLLEKELAGVDIRCNMEGATVKLDGKVLYTAPGRYTGLTTAGPHSIVATKEGYITNELSLPLPAGETKVFELNLMTTDDLTEYRRLWPTYVPYAVLIAGVAIAAAGAALHIGAAQASYKSFDNQVAMCAATHPALGCTLTPELESQRQRADILQGAGIAGYAVGAALVVTGAVLLYANRLQPYRISVGVTSGGGNTLSFFPYGPGLIGTF
jgi:hypothetical protein